MELDAIDDRYDGISSYGPAPAATFHIEDLRTQELLFGEDGKFAQMVAARGESSVEAEVSVRWGGKDTVFSGSVTGEVSDGKGRGVKGHVRQSSDGDNEASVGIVVKDKEKSSSKK
jgi:hypothetical protein